MKYFLVIIQNGETPAIFAYDTIERAQKAQWAEMAYDDASRTSTITVIIDSNGMQYSPLSWKRPVVDTPAEE